MPTLLFFAFAAGLATAVAARVELRISPRTPLSTRSVRAFLVYALMLLIPISVYFYVFHGDWFLLYTIDVTRIPSALALVGFAFEFLLGCVGFAIGGQLVRGQKENLAMFLTVATVALGVAVAVLASRRLGSVGTHAQYHGSFGLVSLPSSPLLPGLVLMGTLLFVGLVALVVRLGWGARRAT